MWNFTREVLMTKDSWKKNRGKPQPPLQQPTKRASPKAHAGGQLLNRRSAAHQCKQPSSSNPPAAKISVFRRLCRLSCCPPEAQRRISHCRHIPQVTSSRVVPFVSRGRCPGASSSEHGTTSDALSSTVALHLSAAKRTRNGPMLN